MPDRVYWSVNESTFNNHLFVHEQCLFLLTKKGTFVTALDCCHVVTIITAYWHKNLRFFKTIQTWHWPYVNMHQLRVTKYSVMYATVTVLSWYSSYNFSMKWHTKLKDIPNLDMTFSDDLQTAAVTLLDLLTHRIGKETIDLLIISGFPDNIASRKKLSEWVLDIDLYDRHDRNSQVFDDNGCIPVYNTFFVMLYTSNV